MYSLFVPSSDHGWLLLLLLLMCYVSAVLVSWKVHGFHETGWVSEERTARVLFPH